MVRCQSLTVGAQQRPTNDVRGGLHRVLGRVREKSNHTRLEPSNPAGVKNERRERQHPGIQRLDRVRFAVVLLLRFLKRGKLHLGIHPP